MIRNSLSIRLKPHLSLLAYIFELFLVWRFILFLGLGLGLFVFWNFHPTFPYPRARLIWRGSPYFWAWGNFDGVHYLQIAQAGYTDEFTQALFPLYPLSIRLVSQLTRLDTLLVGLLISHGCFFLALYFLSQLAPKIGLKQTSLPRFLWYLVLFPTSFFFASLYTESLFLLLSVLCFYFAYQKHWWLAGLFGALATATRFTGIFLFPAVLLLWWSSVSHHLKRIRRNYLSLVTFRLLGFPFPLLLIPIGLLAYMIYLWLTTHNPLFFIYAQPHFSAHRQVSHLVLLPQVFWRYFKMLITVPVDSTFYFPLALETLTGLLFGFLSLLTFRRFGLALGFYTLANYLLPTFTGSFSSLPRYVLVLFPAFIVLTELAERHFLVKLLYQSLAPALLLISVIFFTRGLWIA